MRFRFPFLLILLFLSATSFAESMDDLVGREGLYYKKFSDVPFTGEVDEGLSKGSMKNGIRVGIWVLYYKNGQLWSKSSFNDIGQSDGLFVEYWDDGQLMFKGEYRKGLAEGYWEGYNRDGSVREYKTGTYKEGIRISD